MAEYTNEERMDAFGASMLDHFKYLSGGKDAEAQAGVRGLQDAYIQSQAQKNKNMIMIVVVIIVIATIAAVIYYLPKIKKNIKA